jgi:hypothetical protein
MEARSKPFVEETLVHRTWPVGLPEPVTPVDAILVESIEPVEVDFDELRARGFLPGF